jgi:putative ABC transport system permease protein
MTRTRLVAHSLLYHGRGHLAVALGAAVGAAVLAGALLVGDSLRGSLRARTERQLNGIEHALVADRFFREDLAAELPGKVQPVILFQGTVRAGDRRVGRVTVLGVDERFGLGEFTPTADTAVVPAPLARQLQLKPGEGIELTVQKASAVPRASALSKRDTTSAVGKINFPTVAFLPAGHPVEEFTLVPGPSTPVNLIVPLKTLQRGTEQPGRVNALLSPAQPLQPLQDALKPHLTLEDWGLKVHVPPKRQAYVSVESRRLILEPAAVRAALQASGQVGKYAVQTFVYLANTIAANGAEIPYSVVAGIDPQSPPELNPVGVPFADDEIVLVDWKQSPLKVKPGDAVTLKYFKPEVEGKIEEAEATFKLKAIVPLEGQAADPDLVPEFPGITDKLEISDWDPPFPFDNRRVKKADEDYWKDYRSTPKAYVTLATARKLWGTRFGDTTSVRMTPRDGTPADNLVVIQRAIRHNLDPVRGGFQFDDVAERSRQAGRGSTDFGLLFLAFSFFLIVSALTLVGLLFRLNLERRAREVGLLRATGYPLKTVKRMLLLEGLIVAVIGSLVGLAGGVGYAAGMLAVLAKLWPSQNVGSFLSLHVEPLSLAIGFVASVAMSGLAVWWAIRGLSKIEPSHLLKGVSGDEAPATTPSRWGRRIAIAGLIGAVGLIAAAPLVPAGEPRAGTFFGGGALLLTAGLALVWIWLKRPRRATVKGLSALGVRNATRNPTRSLLTAGLLASAAFLLVAVESFRREPDKDFADKAGGSGGFPLLAEADTPIHFEPDSDPGREETSALAERWVATMDLDGEARDRKQAEAEAVLHGTKVYPFRLRAGDDASCLNLYQATRPRVLGVPDSLVAHGGFRFSGTLAETKEEGENPWLLLAKPGDDIPAFVEENTAVWQLKKGLGDTLEVPDEEGRPVKLRLVGFLKDSVFQSEVLIGDAAFRKAFPRNEGFSYFLLAPPADADVQGVEAAFENSFAPYGLEATRTADRVSAYLAVQNTYLSTFQLLGGFGLLLGVLGLAVVLLRNVWERRAELSLLRAMGYRTGTLNRMVFVENALLLLMGLGAGVLAAVASVAPHVVSGTAIPVGRLAIMLAAVLAVGLLAAGLAVAASGRQVVAGLRQE